MSLCRHLPIWTSLPSNEAHPVCKILSAILALGPYVRCLQRSQNAFGRFTMLSRYRPSIYKLTEMLRALEASPSNYALLFDLQKELLSRIKRTDARIAALKAKRKALVQQKKAGARKEEAKRTKDAIAATGEAIIDAQRLLFFWRCFGDGIAFIYLNKLALKHMLYNTHEYSVKEAAGAILGKVGLRKEWSILKLIISREIPAVLSDLTNTIRHGDICVLIGPDPIPIEVKTSKNRNARVDRQIASLTALTQFLKTDVAKDFRGLDQVARLEVPGSDVSHVDAMNDCIAGSRDSGFAANSPEPGLTYLAVRSVEVASRLDQYMKPRSIVTILNEAKTEGQWMPYFPFVLSIRRKEYLYEFMNGDLTLMIILETDELVAAFAAKGLAATFVDHPMVTLVVTRPGAIPGRDPLAGISTPYFARLFYEFGSITSFVDMELTHLTYLETHPDELATKFGSAHAPPDNPTLVEWPQFPPMKWPEAKQV